MPDTEIRGLFGTSNTEEADLIADLHRERITISSNEALWYMLDLTRTVGDFDSTDYANDSYDFLYNEAIVKVDRQARFYMPAIHAPCNYVIPEFAENLSLFGVTVEEQIELEFNIKELLEISNFIKYSELFRLQNLTNDTLTFGKDSTTFFVKNGESVVYSWLIADSTFQDIYDTLGDDEDFYLETVYSKDTALSSITAFTTTTLSPDVLTSIQIDDEDFSNIGEQNIPKIGDVIKTHTNKYYEIQQVYPVEMKIWSYIAIRAVAKRVPLTNITLPGEDFSQVIANFKSGKF